MGRRLSTRDKGGGFGGFWMSVEGGLAGSGGVGACGVEVGAWRGSGGFGKYRYTYRRI